MHAKSFLSSHNNDYLIVETGHFYDNTCVTSQYNSTWMLLHIGLDTLT
jgi:hypothetical protein